VAGTAVVAGAGLEPTIQLTTRDRNRLGLTGALLGAWALGARNVLCLTGDPTSVGDHPQARGVFDLDVLQLISLVVGLRDQGRLMSGAAIEAPPRFFVGGADVPLAADYRFDRLERKADAGMDFVQTQIVFDVEAFGLWAEQARARGVLDRLFVLAGVAVLRGPRSARFMREHLPGVAVPEGLIERLEEAGPDAEQEGIRATIEIVARLKTIQGIAGIHVMGLGRMDPVRRVIEGAGLLPRTGTP
jgi:methylenetetrahydrofolate reductase (NADPH)